MKRFLLSLLAAAMVLAAVGCAATQPPEEEALQWDTPENAEESVGGSVEPDPEFYQKVSNSVWPYLFICSPNHLDYPNPSPESQARILVSIGEGILRGYIPAPFELDDCFDEESARYIVPRDQFDGILSFYFRNIALEDDALIEQGALLPDKSAYCLDLAGYENSDRFIVQEANWDDDTHLYLYLALYHPPGQDYKPFGFVSMLLEDLGDHFQIGAVIYRENPEFSWSDDPSQWKYLPSPKNLIGRALDGPAADEQIASHQKLGNFLDTYASLCSLNYLGYPTSAPRSQEYMIICVGDAILHGYIPAPFDINDYFDEESWRHIVPRDLFDPVVASYFKDPVWDDDALIELGALLPDKSAYSINLAGYGCAYSFPIRDARWEDETHLYLEVAVSPSAPDSVPFGFIYMTVADQGDHFQIVEVVYRENPERALPD